MFRRKKRGWLAPDAVCGGAPPAGALCEYFEGGNPMKKFLSLVLALVMTAFSGHRQRWSQGVQGRQGRHL